MLISYFCFILNLLPCIDNKISIFLWNTFNFFILFFLFVFNIYKLQVADGKLQMADWILRIEKYIYIYILFFLFFLTFCFYCSPIETCLPLSLHAIMCTFHFVLFLFIFMITFLCEVRLFSFPFSVVFFDFLTSSYLFLPFLTFSYIFSRFLTFSHVFLRFPISQLTYIEIKSYAL